MAEPIWNRISDYLKHLKEIKPRLSPWMLFKIFKSTEDNLVIDLSSKSSMMCTLIIKIIK